MREEALSNKPELGISFSFPSALEGKRNPGGDRHHSYVLGPLESWKGPHWARDLPWSHCPEGGKEKRGLCDPTSQPPERPLTQGAPSGDNWQELQQQVIIQAYHLS